MSIESGLFDVLKTIPSVGSRVYPLILPQNPTYPAIVYQRISSFDTGTIDGTESLDMARFQIKAYARTFQEVITVRDAIKAIMSCKANKLMHMSDYENDTKLYSEMIDYQISDDIINS